MRHSIRKISCAAVLALTVAAGPFWAGGRDQANSGIRALEAGRVDDAIHLLTEGIQSEQLPDEALAMAYHHRGIAHQRRGDLARAILDYTNAMQRGILAEEFRPRALNNRAICFELIGDLEAALRDLNRAIGMRNAYADAYVNRASVLRKMGAHQLAIVDYQRAGALGHARPVQVAFGIAQTLEAAGARTQALKFYRNAAAIDPAFGPARDRIAALTQDATMRMADAGGQPRRSPMSARVGSDAQPSAVPEAMGENTLRATVLDTSGPISGSGFSQDAAAPQARPPRAARPLALPGGPKGGPETSELVPVLKDPPATRVTPAPPQTEVAAPVPAVLDAAQLASYGSEAMARQGWAELSARFAAELGQNSARITAAQHPRKGTVYRLYVTGLSTTSAALCARLKRKGQSCIPASLPATPQIQAPG
jgi:tetratricopeptide (TPR) repeat protein